MNSKELQNLKKKLSEFLEDSEVTDVILFGSAIKGKAIPNDFDIALITNKKIDKKMEGIHISAISPEEIFSEPPSIVSTIIKEGFSLKHNKFLAEKWGFEPHILCVYNLSKQNASDKVRIVRALRGNKNTEGMITEEKGVWLSNSVFLAKVGSINLLDSFFRKNNVEFTKYNLLVH